MDIAHFVSRKTQNRLEKISAMGFDRAKEKKKQWLGCKTFFYQSAIKPMDETLASGVMSNDMII